MSTLYSEQGRTRVDAEAYFSYVAGENPRRTPLRGQRAMKEAVVKRVLKYGAIALLGWCMAFSACSQNEGVESKKGSIEEMTDHAADVIGTRIKTPIDQARSVQGMARERLKRTDKPL